MARLPLAFLFAGVAPLAAQTVPTGFTIDTLVSAGLSTPNDCCFLPDGRCLIANSAGNVAVYAGTSSTAVSIGTVPSVESGGERGLLSIAADPAFPQNGQIYVYYSSTADNFMHLDRFTCTGDLANPASTNLQFAASSRHVLLGVLPDNAGNHNGGSVRFGPDGMLYQTCGDDAGSCNAQILTTQVGCLLRLDVSQRPAGGSLVLPAYGALDPGTNPNSAATDFSQLVLAYGLRNPFRMEIDPVTGSLYIGDVGAGAVEEYSEYVYPTTGPLPLVNFGWPWREGAQTGSACTGSQPAGLVDPIAWETHGGGWAAVMGGARYRNVGGQYDLGANFEGNAFFTDYYAGQLRRLVNTGGTWGLAPAIPGQPSPTNWGTGFNGVTSMRLGPDGGLWFTQHNSNSLKRIRLIGPVPSINAISGGGQRVAAGEQFPQPLVVRVLNPQGQPQPGGQANFTLSGAATLSTTNPVLADANGYASTTVTTQAGANGAITVTATTPNAITQATFGLFARRLTATPAGPYLVMSITNQTSAVPPTVPYVVMLSFPGSPTLPTIVGPLCIDPGYALALVIEDGTGMFGFISFSGTGGTGNPGLTKLYTLPPGIFTGQLMSFQAVGFDAQTGWFRTNCEQRLF